MPAVRACHDRRLRREAALRIDADIDPRAALLVNGFRNRRIEIIGIRKSDTGTSTIRQFVVILSPLAPYWTSASQLTESRAAAREGAAHLRGQAGTLAQRNAELLQALKTRDGRGISAGTQV